MSKDYLQEAIDYFITYQVSAHALYYIAQFACITTTTTFYELAKMSEQNQQNNRRTLI